MKDGKRVFFDIHDLNEWIEKAKLNVIEKVVPLAGIEPARQLPVEGF